jgi:O-antigen ligase
MKPTRIGNIELFCFFTALLGCSLFWSFFLISISSLFLSFLLVFQVEIYPAYKFKLNPNFSSSIQDIIKHPLLLCVIMLFLLGVLSYFWSDNTHDYLKYNQMRLQLLVIPLCILAHKDIPKIYFNWILRVFIATAVISSLFVLYFYIKNHDLYVYALQFSKAIYTPVQHIRYTALLAMAFGTCIFLFTEAETKNEKLLYVIISVFLFIMIHILAVKGSILSLYLICFVMFLTLIADKISIRLRVVLPIVLLLLFCTSLFLIPSLKKKLEYVKHELQEYDQGRWQNLSDIERLVSYEVGIELAMKNPITGVGLGDFVDETKRVYRERWNVSIYKFPHNEFIFQFMSLGILGVILLFGIYYFTLKEIIFRTDILCLSMLISIVMLQLFNDTLESQISVGMTVFVLIIIWTRKNFILSDQSSVN